MTELDQVFGEHIFDRDTAVQRVAANKYTATLTDRWSTVRGPNGGYCLATGLRALAVEMPLPDPVVTAAFFHAPAASGPVEVDTELIRRGRRLATGQARVLQGDREILRALASFADLERTQGRTLELGAPPSLCEREATVDLDPGRAFPRATLLDRFNYRVRELHGWRRGTPGGDPTLEFAIEFAEPRAIDPLALVLIVDVCPRAVYELRESMPLTLELTMHIRARSKGDRLLGRVKTRHLRDGYHEDDLELWDAGGTLVAQSRQLALLPVAAGTAKPPEPRRAAPQALRRR
jgi:Acyl-CoA thioesterase C-terminal domain/Acyl-CoA thioesterase N-terminal domain